MKVWSEREPGSWTECTESAYLMALVYGGFSRFPLGTYTDAERDALDDASAYPGIGNTYPYVDIGAKKRYGVALTNVSGEGATAFHTRLNTPGRALAIAGTMGNLPLGHYLRRWQPGFVGNHAVTVIPQGNGGVLWLDPLAVDDFEGDKASVDDVMRFAWIPSNAREALAGQFEETMPTDWTGTKFQQPKVVTLRKGAPVYADEFATTEIGKLDEDTDFYFPGYTLVQPGAAAMHFVSRLDRQNDPVWVYQEAIIPPEEIPYRRYTLDDGSVALLADLRTRIATAKAALG